MARADDAAEAERLADEAAQALDEEDPEAALAAAARGEKLARRAGEEALAAELQLLQASALNQLGRSAEALSRTDALLAAEPDAVDAMLERGFALWELCRLDEARAQLLEALHRDPDLAWASHTLGLVAERRGEAQEAERRFARARALSPDEFPAPPRLPHEEFDRAVEAALEELPEPVRRWLANVAIAVEDLPRDEDLAGDPPLSPAILGVFRGAPLGEKASMDPWSHFPSSIVLYQRNLERFAHDRDELVDEIGVTLVHEVGHFLGLDEDELWERGLG
jgi:predicted Zn-dependent protease with MMP-like domain